MESSRNPSTIYAYFASFIALGMFAAILGPTLPGLAENTSSTMGQIGFLFTARSLGYLLGSLRSGKLYDRLPGHLLLTLVLVSLAALLAIVPLVSQLWVLLILLLVLGMGEGALDIGPNLLTVWLYRHRSTPYLNALHFFFGIGASLSPVIFAQVNAFGGGILWTFWLIALFPLPVALWLFRLPSPKPPAETSEQVSGQANTLLLVLLALIFLLYVGAEASFGGWIFTYATTSGLGEVAGAAYLTSAFWGALTAGRLLSIPIAARLRPRLILLADLAGCLVSVAVIIFFPQSYAAVWIGAIGLGLCMASIFPTLLAFASRRMVLSGNITRWFFVATGAGGMLLPFFAGVLFENIGPLAFMVAVLIDLTLALLFFLASVALDLRSSSFAEIRK